jgi:hypothetical protein
MLNTTPVMYADNPNTTSQVTYAVQSQMQGPTGSNYLWFNRGYDTSGGDAASATSFLTALEGCIMITDFSKVNPLAVFRAYPSVVFI